MSEEYEQEADEYVLVCEECGAPLAEILVYGRYFCENCQLHY